MAEYTLWKTEVDTTSGNNNVAIIDSYEVTIWFGETAPSDPSLYDVVIIDGSDGSTPDGKISDKEWANAIGNEGPKLRGDDISAEPRLYDPNPANSDVGFLYSGYPISAGDPNLLDGLTQGFNILLADIVICFAKGTLIETISGPRRVETLSEGDLILTKDDGYQPLKSVSVSVFPGKGSFAPVRIATGAMGNHRPHYVSQNHRMLVTGADVELLFGQEEVLVMAKSLCGLPGFDVEPCDSVSYYHLTMPTHSVIFGDGVASESYFEGNWIEEKRANAVASPDFGSAHDDDNRLGTCRMALTHKEGQALARSGRFEGVEVEDVVGLAMVR